jgi:hypothetical protein
LSCRRLTPSCRAGEVTPHPPPPCAFLAIERNTRRLSGMCRVGCQSRSTEMQVLQRIDPRNAGRWNDRSGEHFSTLACFDDWPEDLANCYRSARISQSAEDSGDHIVGGVRTRPRIEPVCLTALMMASPTAAAVDRLTSPNLLGCPKNTAGLVCDSKRNALCPRIITNIVRQSESGSPEFLTKMTKCVRY